LDIKPELVARVEAVFNGDLLKTFALERLKIERRLAEDAHNFAKKSWMMTSETAQNKERRKWTRQVLDNMIENFPWNSDLRAHILPMIHGTDYSIALKICNAGFAKLCQLDPGFYGKGIYFSSNLEYCVPYFSYRAHPAFIITFVVPGNSYPIIEKADDEKNFFGKALMPGYNSHFVITRKDGIAVDTVAPKEYYSELVSDQEALALPAYIIQINKEVLSKYLQETQQAPTSSTIQLDDSTSPAKSKSPEVARQTMTENSEKDLITLLFDTKTEEMV